MRTIVIGAGEVGQSIAQYLLQEQHPVVLIDDNEERLALISEQLDIQTVCGRGSYPEVLEAAGAETADMLIAVTPSDEINMVACQMAYSLFNVPKKIARVRESSYLKLMDTQVYSQHHMPVDVVISPELEVAEAMARALSVPGAFEVFHFPHSNALLVGIAAQGTKPVSMKKWPPNLPHPIAIERYGRLLIPSSSDYIEPRDGVFFLLTEQETNAVLTYLGHDAKPLENLMLIGGGNVGYNLARHLEGKGKNIRIVEYNEKRAQELGARLDDVTVLQGDGLNRNLLMQENITQMDAVLCVTSNDSVNLLSTVQAKQFHIPHIYTLLHEAGSLPLADYMNLDRVVSPREITASRILQHVRRAHVGAVHSLADGAGEVMALHISATSKLAGQPLERLALTEGAKMVGLLRPFAQNLKPSRHESMYTLYTTEKDMRIQAGDMLVVVALSQSIQAVEALCA